jgi:hypothetical protein
MAQWANFRLRSAPAFASRRASTTLRQKLPLSFVDNEFGSSINKEHDQNSVSSQQKKQQNHNSENICSIEKTRKYKQVICSA